MNIDIKIAQKFNSVLRKYIEFRKNSIKLRNDELWKSKFKGSSKFIHKLDDDLSINLYEKSILSRLIYEGFEENEIAFVKKFLKPGDTFIDIGANMGLFSLYAAKIVGELGRVHSFEPTPETYIWLEENILLNNLDGIIRSNNVGLSESRGFLKLNISDSGKDAWNTFASDSKINFGYQLDIEVETLDNYILENSIDVVDINLVKIDVEGWELKVFKGAEKLLSSVNAPTLLVEFTESNLFAAGTNCYELFDYIVSLGYRWFDFDSKQNKLIPEIKRLHYPYNNLIAIKNIDDVNNRILNFQK